MRLFSIIFLSLCFGAGLVAQPELSERAVEGYIIDNKGQRSEGIIFLNDDPEEYVYLLQNRVGFLPRAEFDKIDKKVRAKDFETFKPKDLAEYGFGERRFLSRPYVAPGNDETDLARMGRNYFFELHLAAGPVEILRIRTVADKTFGTDDGNIYSDIAIYREDMKRPEVSSKFDYQTFVEDCEATITKLKNGHYASLKYREGKKKKKKIGLGSMIRQSVQDLVDPPADEDIFNLVADYVEACVEEK